MREAIRNLRRLLAGEEVIWAQGPPASGMPVDRVRVSFLLIFAAHRRVDSGTTRA